MSWLSRSKDDPAKRSGIVTVLDVGSSKVCCVIARLKPRDEAQLLKGRTHNMQVIGIGHQMSGGVKSGVVVDLDRAEQAIRLAVDAAERTAGLTVDSLIVNLTAGRLKSETFSATVRLGGHAADMADIDRVLAAVNRRAMKNEREVVHSLPVGFSIDAEKGVRDPKGMVGETLGVSMHVLSGDSAPIRNLELCVNRAHLSVERMVASPYASGLASLVDDELEMGAACIDMGGGTTTISIFAEGRFAYADALPLGGNHVTMDLARGLSTRLEDAERLKVMHGSLLPGGTDERDIISYQPIGAEETDLPVQIPSAVMSRIIRARVEETLEHLRDRLNRSGFGKAVGKRVVLTGGASQLPGLPEAARRILGRSARIGRPLGVAGLPQAAKGPAFATVVGLLVYPQTASFENSSRGNVFSMRSTGTGGKLNRMSQWFRESF